MKKNGGMDAAERLTHRDKSLLSLLTHYSRFHEYMKTISNLGKQVRFVEWIRELKRIDSAKIMETIHEPVRH